MTDSAVEPPGAGDPVPSLADELLDRYGVEDRRPGDAPPLGAGPARFAESLIAGRLGAVAPDADTLLARMGRLGGIGHWLSFLDLPLGAGDRRPVGYRAFLTLDPVYLPVEADDEGAGGADAPVQGAPVDPEAWKLWTLFPQAAPAPAGEDGSAPGRGAGVRAGLDPRLSARPGQAAAGILVSGRDAPPGAWRVSARHLPALAGSLAAAARRGVGEGAGGRSGGVDPAALHLVRAGLLAGRPGDAAPERRDAGLDPWTAAASTADPALVRMGLGGWTLAGAGGDGRRGAGAPPERSATGPAAPPGAAITQAAPARSAAAWAAGAGLPAMPAAVFAILPRGWRHLADPAAAAAPIGLPSGPLTAAAAERLLRDAPEVARWFRHVGARLPRDRQGGVEAGRVLGAAYVAWVESVRHAAGVAAAGAGAAEADRRAREAQVAALPPELRPAGRVLAARGAGGDGPALPGASGALARRLERFVPRFASALGAGDAPGPAGAAAARAIDLPADVGVALALALMPALARAGRFVPAGMVEVGAARGEGAWGRPGRGRAGGGEAPPASLTADRAPVAPLLAVLVERARQQGVALAGLSGLPPAEMLRALAEGPAAAGLPPEVRALLRDLRGGVQSAVAAPAVGRALRALLAAAPGAPESLGDLPAGLRGDLLRAYAGRAVAPHLAAALTAAGLPADPAAAVALLLRSETPGEGARRALAGHLRAAGAGELTGPQPEDGAPWPSAPPWTGADHAVAAGAAAPADLDLPALARAVLHRARRADAAHRPAAERFVPAGSAPGPSARSSGGPAGAAEAVLLRPDGDGPEEGGGWPVPDRPRTPRTEPPEAALLLPPALRAALGGRALPPEVQRRLLGLAAGGGPPASLDDLVALLSPLSTAMTQAPPVALSGKADGGLGVPPAAETAERRRVLALAERIGRTLKEVAGRAGRLGIGDVAAGADAPWARAARSALARAAGLGAGDLVKLAEGGDTGLWQRVARAVGPDAARWLTPEALRTALEAEEAGEAALSADGGPGELIGPERRSGRRLREAAESERRGRAARDERIRARAEAERREQDERVARHHAEERRRREEQREPVSERTVRLARALFPQSIARMPEGGRRMAFPSAFAGNDQPDLMLVAPTTEIIRREAAPLLKESPAADDVRAGASQAPTQQRGDDPARLEKFLSPEKIEEFARRSYELLLDEISVDAEVHGLDPYGWE